MQEIKISKLTKEEFSIFGQFHDMFSKEGYGFGDNKFKFYRDSVRMSADSVLGFSTLRVKKDEKLEVTALEYHDKTAEVMIPLDDDAVLCLAPAGNLETPLKEDIRAFYIPQGTLIHLNPGTWHFRPMPVYKEEVNVLIVLPERTYKVDLIAKEYIEDNIIRLVL